MSILITNNKDAYRIKVTFSRDGVKETYSVPKAHGSDLLRLLEYRLKKDFGVECLDVGLAPSDGA